MNVEKSSTLGLRSNVEAIGDRSEYYVNHENDSSFLYEWRNLYLIKIANDLGLDRQVTPHPVQKFHP